MGGGGGRAGIQVSCPCPGRVCQPHCVPLLRSLMTRGLLLGPQRGLSRVPSLTRNQETCDGQKVAVGRPAFYSGHTSGPSPTLGRPCLLWALLLNGWASPGGAGARCGAASRSLSGPSRTARGQQGPELQGRPPATVLVVVLTAHHQGEYICVYTNPVVKFSFSYCFVEEEAHKSKIKFIMWR